jgi:hypothetical protein
MSKESPSVPPSLSTVTENVNTVNKKEETVLSVNQTESTLQPVHVNHTTSITLLTVSNVPNVVKNVFITEKLKPIDQVVIVYLVPPTESTHHLVMLQKDTIPLVKLTNVVLQFHVQKDVGGVNLLPSVTCV